MAEILTFLLGVPAATDLKQKKKKCYFIFKIFVTYCEKKIGREKRLKFKVEGREFAKFFRLLEQLIQPVKGQYIF